MADSTQENQTMFNAYYTFLVNNFGPAFGVSGGGPSDLYQFQITNAAETPSAGWVDSLDLDAKIQEFGVGNRAPVTKKGRYTSGPESKSIYDNYKYWVNNVQPDNPTSDYRQALRNQIQFGGDMTKVMRNSLETWTAWQSNNPSSPIKTQENWLSQVPAPPNTLPFAPQYQGYQAKYVEASRKVTTILASMGADRIAAAQTAVIAQPNLTKYYPAGQGAGFTAGTTWIGDDTANPQTDWTSWTGGGSLHKNPLSIKIVAGERPIHHLESVTVTERVTASFFFGLISITYEEQETFFEDFISYGNYELDQSFGSLNSYAVSRPGWFDDQFLTNFKDHSYGGSEDFFNSETGSLYLIPRRVFLGWDPVLKLTVDNVLYQKWQSALTSKEGVVIGGGVTVGVGQIPTVQDGPSGTKILTFGDASTQSSHVSDQLGFIMDRTKSTASPAMALELETAAVPTAGDNG